MLNVVTGCSDCPLFNDGQQYEFEAICKHPQAPPQFFEPLNPDAEVKRIEIEMSGSFERPVTPYWCPLKLEQLTLFFNGKDS